MFKFLRLFCAKAGERNAYKCYIILVNKCNVVKLHHKIQKNTLLSFANKEETFAFYIKLEQKRNMRVL